MSFFFFPPLSHLLFISLRTVVLDRKETILFTVQFVDTDSKEGSKHPTMMGQTGAFEIFVYHETPPDLLSFIFYAGIVTVAVLAIIGFFLIFFYFFFIFFFLFFFIFFYFFYFYFFFSFFFLLFFPFVFLH